MPMLKNIFLAKKLFYSLSCVDERVRGAIKH